MKIAPEELAKKFHDVYEGFAPAHNYKTNNETKVFNPDSANGKLMIATCKSILEWLDESEDTEGELRKEIENLKEELYGVKIDNENLIGEIRKYQTSNQ